MMVVVGKRALRRRGRMYDPARPSIRPMPRFVHRVRALIVAL